MQLFAKERYDEQVDIYAMGVVCNEVMRRKTPYAELVASRKMTPHILMQEVKVRGGCRGVRTGELASSVWGVGAPA